MSINFSGTVVVHALGYYLTEKYGIPHGLANALFLPRLYRVLFGEKVPRELLHYVCKRLGIASR
ncbi:MAG: iron-containing alcohol dehydrogenase [Aigarchaeota archaeon]|nr:iron-containing alcohol dehydrogenase [Candidatus Wolframiiraptor gerlachensis]